jgi:hypothetical protein
MTEPATPSPSTPGADPLLSPQLIADISGLSYDTVRREMLRGRLRAFKVGGRLRVRQSDYERWAYREPVTPPPRRLAGRPRRRAPAAQSSERGSVTRLNEIERRLTSASQTNDRRSDSPGQVD